MQRHPPVPRLRRSLTSHQNRRDLSLSLKTDQRLSRRSDRLYTESRHFPRTITAVSCRE